MQVVLERYLNKHALYPQLLKESFSDNIGIAVCIPCYDEPNVIATLQSLANCEKPSSDVAVIILINQPVDCVNVIDQINQLCFEDIVQWEKEHDSFLQIYPLRIAFENTKHVGVGLARKVAMDESIRQYQSINKDGLIVCLDADCSVDENYFIEIEKYFRTNPKIGAASINFQHSLIDLPEPLYTSILGYELHLRYYRRAQRYTGYPHAFYTIGSCMAVRATAYAAYGGMNRRQAGEDFYFLSKFMEAGKMGEINTTTVYPSARMSDRVPFGTGRIMEEAEGQEFKTYAFEIFREIKQFLNIMKQKGYMSHYDELLSLIPSSVFSFLEKQKFNENLQVIRSNTSSEEAFLKRFYRWLNPLQFLKLVHHLRDKKYGKGEVGNQANKLLNTLDYNTDRDNLTMLKLLRKLDEGAKK